MEGILKSKVDEENLVKIIEEYIGEDLVINCSNCKGEDIENNKNFPFYCFVCKSYICDDCYYHFKKAMFCSQTSCVNCFTQTNNNFIKRCIKCEKLLCKLCCSKREDRIKPYEVIEPEAQLYCLDCIFKLDSKIAKTFESKRIKDNML